MCSDQLLLKNVDALPALDISKPIVLVLNVFTPGIEVVVTTPFVYDVSSTFCCNLMMLQLKYAVTGTVYADPPNTTAPGCIDHPAPNPSNPLPHIPNPTQHIVKSLELVSGSAALKN